MNVQMGETYWPYLTSRLQDALSPTTVSSPSSSRLVSQIIGAEDDYFDSDQEQVFLGDIISFIYLQNPTILRKAQIQFQVTYRLRLEVLTVFQTNGQCNSFNSIELLKSRPAHLAAFLYHVISQFDPAPVVRLPSYLLMAFMHYLQFLRNLGPLLWRKFTQSHKAGYQFAMLTQCLLSHVCASHMNIWPTTLI